MLSAKFVILLLLQALVVWSKQQRQLPNDLWRNQPRLYGRIVGGRRINITDAPYQVSLQTRRDYICGGALISDQWILTAAHCTDAMAEDNIFVRLGSSESLRHGTRKSIRKVVQHKEYNPRSMDYDFSLVQLKRPINFDKTKNATKLPEPGQVFEDGEPCYVSGWGDTRNKVESSQWLRQVKVPLFNRDLCEKKYSIMVGFTDRMICAGFLAGGKDACQGDSGGPMVNEAGVLVGVVSWGFGCASPNYPGVYSRVASVRNWIKEHTGI